MKKIVVIGGGASGLVAAIFASKKNKDVTILERNQSCGKKILVTGNGRCNFWNEDQSLTHYRSNHIEKLKEIITKDNQINMLTFFKKIGIEPKVKNGYYYPFSNQAISMQNALIQEATKSGVKIQTNAFVKEVRKIKNTFTILMQNGENIIADKVILATGSKAAPKTGSDGMGYDICKKLNINMVKPLPALVQLRANETFLKQWEGIRADVKIDLYEENQKIATQKGEIQLTNYGVSGICVFNLSGRIARGLEKNKQEIIEINFLDGLNLKTINDFIQWMNRREQLVKDRTIYQLLEGVLNYKLVKVLLKKSNLKQEDTWHKITQEQKNTLANNLVKFKLNIVGTNSFDKAQVCSGGVILDEINEKTMEVEKISGLYITGEILDVDADCGGYNLEWAWITGMIAGLNV